MFEPREGGLWKKDFSKGPVPKVKRELGFTFLEKHLFGYSMNLTNIWHVYAQ